jgi:hypothetical protein
MGTCRNWNILHKKLPVTCEERRKDSKAMTVSHRNTGNQYRKVRFKK